MTAGGDFVEALAIAVPPPVERAGLPRDAWSAFTSENDFDPPVDYRAVFDRWGFGGWGWNDDSWAILTLDSPFARGGVVEANRWVAENCLSLRRQFPDIEPDFPVWPHEPRGWMPIGSTVDGDLLGLFREGSDPDRWPVGWWAHDGTDASHRLEMGVAEFLYRFATGTSGVRGIDRYAIAAGRAGAEPCFFPADDADHAAPALSSRSVTVITDGIGPVDVSRAAEEEAIRSSLFADEADLDERRSRMLRWREVHEAIVAPAQTIVDAWTREIAGDGIVATGGVHASRDEPMHWSIELTFAPSQENVARRAVTELARRLGAGIVDCRDATWSPVWHDLPD